MHRFHLFPGRIIKMIPVDGDFILSVAPRFSGARAEAQSRIVGEISAVFAPTLDDYNIDSRLRIAHFMGQVTHECAGFRTTEEFASGAAYEGREDLGSDNDFGPATELAVMMFQKQRGLAADGIVGRNTWTSLRS
jgi:peptidoglycan hydrolase-like protein with peptidoglycan-binding domain